MSEERKALGVTLDDLGIRDLLSSAGPLRQPKPGEAPSSSSSVKAQWVSVDLLSPNPYQPRKQFSAMELEKLAHSIKTQGVLQPVLVREVGNRYELIAGERRLRASQIAGLTTIPVVVKNISDQACLVLALIENIQRQELNVIELAESLQSLVTRYGMTHVEVGKMIGKSRASVSNLIRLIQLEDKIKSYLAQGLLDMGHARCLLAAPKDKQLPLADRIIEGGLSVRQSEGLVKQASEEKLGTLLPGRSEKKPVPTVFSSIKDKWRDYFGVGVAIKPHASKPGGVLQLSFKDEAELKLIHEKLNGG